MVEDYVVNVNKKNGKNNIQCCERSRAVEKSDVKLGVDQSGFDLKGQERF